MAQYDPITKKLSGGSMSTRTRYEKGHSIFNCGVKMKISKYEQRELWQQIIDAAGSRSAKEMLRTDCNLVSIELGKEWGFGESYNVWRSYKVQIEVLNKFVDKSKVTMACKLGLESKQVNIDFVKRWN